MITAAPGDTRAIRAAARQVTAAATLALTIAAAVVAWGAVVERFRNAEPLEVRGRPQAIVWDDRVFRSEAHLAAFLRGRGISYERWARNHPAAVAILRPAPIVVSTAAPRSQARTARSADRAPAAIGGPTLSAASLVVPLAALFGLAMAIGASAVSRSARDGARRSAIASLVLRYRLYVLAAAAGVALAVLISVAR